VIFMIVVIVVEGRRRAYEGANRRLRGQEHFGVLLFS
jgi:hypothetical protein